MNNNFPEELTWANEPVLRKEEGDAYIDEVIAGPHTGHDLDTHTLIEAVAKEEGIQYDPSEFNNVRNELLSMFLVRHAIAHVNRKIQGGFGSLSPLLKNYLFRTLLEMHNAKYTAPSTFSEFVLFKSAVGSRDLIKNFAVGKEVYWNFFTTLDDAQQAGSVLFVIRCKSNTSSTTFSYSPGLFISALQGVRMVLPGTKMVVQAVDPEHSVVELSLVSNDSDFLFGSAFYGVVRDFYTAFLTPGKSVVKWKCDERFAGRATFTLYKGCYDQQLAVRSFEALYRGDPCVFEYPSNPGDAQFYVFFFVSARLGAYEVFSGNIVNYVASIDTRSLRVDVRCDFMLGLNRLPRISWRLVQERPVVEPENVVYALLPVYNGMYYQELYRGKDARFTLTNSEVFAPGTTHTLCVSAQLVDPSGSSGGAPVGIAQGSVTFTVQAPMEQVVPELSPLGQVPGGASLEIENYFDGFSYVYFFWRDGAPTEVFKESPINSTVLIRGLEPATKYFVTAMNYRKGGGACGDIAQPVEILTPPLDPLPPAQQPRNFRVKAVAPSSIEVEWDLGENNNSNNNNDDDDAISYEVLYRPRENELNYWFKSVNVEGQERSAVIRGLQLEQEYELVLTANSASDKYFRCERPLYARTRAMAAVQHARCTVLGPSEARLQWDAAPLGEGMAYMVQVRDLGLSKTTGKCELTLVGLPPASRHVVDILVHESGVGYVSSPATVEFATPALPQLPKPANLRAEEVQENAVTLAWDPSTQPLCAIFYAVLFRPVDNPDNLGNPGNAGNAGNGEFQLRCQVREPRCVVDGLLANAEYEFQVVQVYEQGNAPGGPPSDPLRVRTRGFAFADSRLECVSKTKASVTLRWAPFPAQGVRYKVYGGPQGQLLARTADAKCAVEGLEPDTEYTLRVAAVVEGRGESAPSEPPLVVRTNAAYTPPKVPGVKAARTLHDRVEVTWDQIPDPPVPLTYTVTAKRSCIPMDGDVVFEGTLEDFAKRKYRVVCGGLAPSTEYAIGVFASAEARGEATQLVVTTKAVPSLAPPANLRVAQRTYDALMVAWDAGAVDPDYGPITYDVTLDGALLVEALDACEYRARGLKPKAKYVAKVVATAREIKAASAPAALCCETLPHFMDAPGNFRCKSVTPREAVVAWDPADTSALLPGESLLYKMEYRKDYESEYSARTAKIPGSECEFAATGLDPDTKYEFALYVSCDGGATFNKDCAKLALRTEQLPMPALTGFTVAGIGPTYATVMWNAVRYSGELKVVVKIYDAAAAAAAAPRTPIITQETHAESLRVGKLTENTNYIAEAYCLRPDGAEGPHVEKKFVTLNDSMPQPSALLANCDAYDRATITWVPPPVDEEVFSKEDVSYKLELELLGGNNIGKREISIDEYATNRIVVDALRPSTRYRATLRALRSRPRLLESNKLEREFVTPGVPIPDPAPSDFEVLAAPDAVTFRLVAENPLFDGPEPLLRVSVNGTAPADSGSGNRGPITIGGLAANSEHTFEICFTDPSSGAQKAGKIVARTPSFESDVLEARDSGTVRYASRTKAVKVGSPEVRLRDKPAIVTIGRSGPLSLAFGRERVADNMSYILVGFCEKDRLRTAGVFGDGFFLDVGLGTAYAGYPLNYFARKVPEFRPIDMEDGRKRVNITTTVERGEDAGVPDERVRVEMNDALVFSGLPTNLVPIVSLFFDDDSVEVLNQ